MSGRAIVVGVDAYPDLADARTLSGAVTDALAWCDWLTSVQLLAYDEIDLFVSASPDQHPNGIVHPSLRGEARSAEIEGAILDLAASSAAGDQLFVVLCGHGIWETMGGELFLLADARSVGHKNLGLAYLSDYMLSLPFPRQLLVFDGCLNVYRPPSGDQIQPGTFGNRRQRRPETRLIQLFAAEMTQVAREADGRGLLSSEFLAATGAQPDPASLIHDFEIGETWVEIDRLVRNVIEPRVAARAAQLRPPSTQRPHWRAVSAGGAMSARRIVRTLVPTTPIRFEPAGLQLTHLSVISNRLEAFVHTSTFPPASLPTTLQVPEGSAIAHGIVPPGVSLEHSQIPFDTRRDNSVEFRLGQPPGSQPRLPTTSVTNVVHVEVVDEHGETVGFPVDYQAIESSMGDVADVFHHETGPELVFHAAQPDWMRVGSGKKTVEEHVHDSAPGLRVAVRLQRYENASEGGALAVAWSEPGDEELFAMLRERGWGSLQPSADRIDSPNEPLDEVIFLPSGPGQLRLALPWRTWAIDYFVRAGEVTIVDAPSISREAPLWAAWRSDSSQGAVIVRSSGPVSVGFDLNEQERIESGPDEWVTHNFGQLAEEPQALILRDRRNRAYEIAYLPLRSLLIDVGEGGLRIEPIVMLDDKRSALDLNPWDVIAAGAGPTSVPSDAWHLVYDKWEDWLPAVLGAHAAARMDWPGGLDALAVVDNLRGLCRDSNVDPDTILDLHLFSDPEPQVVQQLAERQAIPLFRLGLPGAIVLARKAGHEPWYQRLAEVQRQQVPESMWTAWRLRNTSDRPDE